MDDVAVVFGSVTVMVMVTMSDWREFCGEAKGAGNGGKKCLAKIGEKRYGGKRPPPVRQKSHVVAAAIADSFTMNHDHEIHILPPIDTIASRLSTSCYRTRSYHHHCMASASVSTVQPSSSPTSSIPFLAALSSVLRHPSLTSSLPAIS